MAEQVLEDGWRGQYTGYGSKIQLMAHLVHHIVHEMDDKVLIYAQWGGLRKKIDAAFKEFGLESRAGQRNKGDVDR